MRSSSNSDKSEKGPDIDDSRENKRQRLDSDLKSIAIALKLIKFGNSDKLREILVKKDIYDTDIKYQFACDDQPYT